MLKNILFIYCIFFISCNNNQVAKSSTTNEKPKIILVDSIEKELPFIDSNTMFKAGIAGYQDTFSVDKQKFRILHHDSLYDGILQKFQDNSWKNILSFENLGNYNDYYTDKDLNNDGFNDICLYWKWNMQVFFFEPMQKTFSYKPLMLSYNWSLIDTQQGIYCNYQETKTAQAFSELYKIKNNSKYVYYMIDFVANEDDKQNLQNIILYKCKKGNEDSTTKIKELSAEKNKDFDFQKWWIENYKWLMSRKE